QRSAAERAFGDRPDAARRTAGARDVLLDRRRRPAPAARGRARAAAARAGRRRTVSAGREPSATRRRRTLAMLIAVAAAVAPVPGELLPWAWLLALVLPSALVAGLAAVVRPPLFVLLAGALLQLGACWAAWRYCGPIERPAALAGTILPPLAFVASRRHD